MARLRNPLHRPRAQAGDASPEVDPLASVLRTEAQCDAVIAAADLEAEATLASARARVEELEAESPGLLRQLLAELEATVRQARQRLAADTVLGLQAQVARYDGVDDARIARLGEWVARVAAGMEPSSTREDPR